MNALRAVKLFRVLFILGGFILIGTVGIGRLVYDEIALELRVRHQFGRGWEAQYEALHGSLGRAHLRVGLGVFGVISVSALTVWLCRLLSEGPGTSKRKPQRFRAGLERKAGFQKRALPRVYFGLATALLGTCMVGLRFRIFPDVAVQQGLGVLLFAAGDAAVMSGCFYWLKAKQQNEALVVIGVLPLAPLLIPFVRLLLITHVGLLFLAMPMMAAILVVVVFALPDRGARRFDNWSHQQLGQERNPQGRSSLLVQSRSGQEPNRLRESE